MTSASVRTQSWIRSTRAVKRSPIFGEHEPTVKSLGAVFAAEFSENPRGDMQFDPGEKHAHFRSDTENLIVRVGSGTTAGILRQLPLNKSRESERDVVFKCFAQGPF